MDLSSLTHVVARQATGAPVPEDEEYYSSWSLFLVCLLLILSLWTSYYLQIKRIRVVNETLISIAAGMFVGLIVRLAPGEMIKDMLTFRHTLFFNLLLPPIILNSGYELKQENFFRNFASILTFAFLGTFISAVGIGVLVYIWSFLGLESMNLTLIDCLAFGSTLSATDPVTILAIFKQYKVDPKLYTIIFGESLINDAVSIVMYETLTRFHGTEIYVSSLFHGLGIFLLTFSVSMALGVAFGLSMSLLLKHSSLNLYPEIETCLVSLIAYTSYFLSNGLSMSGIVSLLFCGITLKHYAYHTMSRRTQRATKYIFATLAQLTENFIFVYLGLSLFTSAPSSEPVTSYVKPLFITITTVAVIFTRYAAVFPLSEAINFFQRHARGQRTEELPHSYQMMLFWAGLRGAVGVALAAGFQGPNGPALRTTVLIVVLVTVVFFGGTTAHMIEVLGIRSNVEEEANSSDDDMGHYGPLNMNGWNNRRSSGGRWGRYDDDDGGYLPPRGSPGRIGMHYGIVNSYSHHAQVSPRDDGNVFSAASSESFDSDGEVLPMAASAMPDANRGHVRSASGTNVPGTEDGKWFQDLDERYLLPIFSNATASRTFHARRARRNQAGSGLGSPTGMSTPVDSEEENDAVELELGMTRPRQSNGGVSMPSSPLVSNESRNERRFSTPTLRRESEGQNRGS